MTEKRKCLVVVPMYRELAAAEQFCFKRICDNFSDFDIALITPESLPVTQYQGFKHFTFDDRYFKSVASYNGLMLRTDFYNRFIDYEYILITQLDVLILKNNLADFLKLNYDYIGAPWLNGYKYIHRISGGGNKQNL